MSIAMSMLISYVVMSIVGYGDSDDGAGSYIAGCGYAVLLW